MKRYSLIVTIVSILILLIANKPALAEWSPGDNYKMHNPQLPDSNGYDVCFVHQAIADDFKCSERGYIRDIHFWVSWRSEVEDDFNNVSWDVSIHANAAGKPGAVLWTLNAANADIKYHPYGTGNQGWYCPSTGQNFPNDHTKFYQVNITEITDPFYQTEGQIYWLVIQAEMREPPAEVGWKTSTSNYFSHAQYKTPFGGWLPLGIGAHDLAFVITYTPSIEVDLLDMTHVAELITPLGKEFFNVAGLLTWKVFFEGPAPGDAHDDDGDGREEVLLEVVNFDWTGTSSLYGLVEVREHQTLLSLGEIEERENVMVGRLDLPPFAPAGLADIKIEFYFEIEFNGQKFYTNQPSTISNIITHKPPGPGGWFCWHEHRPLLATGGNATNSYFALGAHITGPTFEVDPFEFSRAQIEVRKKGSSTEVVEMNGFSSVYSIFKGDEEGLDDDSNRDGLDDCDTEMVALDLKGSSPIHGDIKIRLNPRLHSPGQIEEQNNITPGVLDIRPFIGGSLNGDYPVDSFFDIFTELDIPDSGLGTLHNVLPLRFRDIIVHKPPKDGSYESSDVVPLVDANDNPTIYSIGPSLYFPGYCGDYEHQIPIGDHNKDCIVNLLDLAIFAQHWLECTRSVCP